MKIKFLTKDRPGNISVEHIAIGVDVNLKNDWLLQYVEWGPPCEKMTKEFKARARKHIAEQLKELKN